MLFYSNSVTCSTNQNKSEFILTFRQHRPVIDESGAVTGVDMETVSQIVMNADNASALCALLNAMLGTNEE